MKRTKYPTFLIFCHKIIMHLPRDITGCIQVSTIREICSPSIIYQRQNLLNQFQINQWIKSRMAWLFHAPDWNIVIISQELELFSDKMSNKMSNLLLILIVTKSTFSGSFLLLLKSWHLLNLRLILNAFQAILSHSKVMGRNHGISKMIFCFLPRAVSAISYKSWVKI